MRGRSFPWRLELVPVGFRSAFLKAGLDPADIVRCVSMFPTDPAEVVPLLVKLTVLG